MREMAIMKQPVLMKPIMRIVHTKPRLGTSDSKRRGKRTPPTGPEVVTTPVVIARLS
jgi:hypothetical protein